MDRQAIRSELPAIVAAHVPKNQRKLTFCFYDGAPVQNAFGLHVDPKPFKGKVIAVTEAAIVVKTGRAEFAVVDLALSSQRPDLGAKVSVTPYFRRDFQRERLDKRRRREHVSRARFLPLNIRPRSVCLSLKYTLRRRYDNHC